MLSRLTLIQKGLIVIAAPLLLQLFFVGLVAFLTRHINEARDLTVHTRSVITQAQAILTELFESETATRGYALQQDPNGLASHQRDAEKIREMLVQLRLQVQDNAAQVKHAELLAAKVDRLLSWQGETIAGIPTSDAAKIKARFADVDARTQMEDLRREIDVFLAAERAFEQARVTELNNASDAIQLTLLFTVAISCLGTVTLAYFSNNEIRNRLLVLADNAQRLANRQALAAPMKGHDEISQADHAFHAMAASLNQAAAELRRSSEEIRDLYNNAPCGYHSLDHTGTFVAINDTELAWLGCRREDVIGKMRFDEFLSPPDRDRFQAALTRVVESGVVANVEYDLQSKGGETIPVLINALAIRDEQGRFLASRTTVFNIAERKLAEKERDEQRALLQTVLDCMGDGVIAADAKGEFVVWNPAAERIMGAGPRSTEPSQWPQTYGIYLADMVTPTPYADLPLVRAMRGEDVDDMVIYARNAETPAGKWLSVTARPLKDKSGVFSGGVAVIRDITEQKSDAEIIQTLNEELEERVMERTLELAEANRELKHKNQENEMFVYSVSHDLRSPLVNLEGFSKELGMISADLRQLLQDSQVPEGVRARGLGYIDNDMGEAIRFIQAAVKRLSNIIDALLRLSRAGRIDYVWNTVDPAPLVARIVDSMKSTISEHSAVIVVGELARVWGDATALEQVFANLIGNALNYLDPKRPGRVEVGMVSADEGYATFFVKDNGAGIPEAYVHKIFQAFQRLQPEIAPGEGMGLAIVRRVVERHRGRVWVESKVDQGSTFYVTLPTSADSMRQYQA